MAPKRIQLSRAKGWRKPEGTVVVSRPGKWGNPWRVGVEARIEWDVDPHTRQVQGMVLTPELAVELYRIAFTPDAEEIRAELAGKDLACWCPLTQPCHADVLIEIANRPPQEG